MSYNNGRNTLMQYLMTISNQSFVPYVKIVFVELLLLLLLRMNVIATL